MRPYYDIISDFIVERHYAYRVLQNTNDMSMHPLVDMPLTLELQRQLPGFSTISCDGIEYELYPYVLKNTPTQIEKIKEALPTSKRSPFELSIVVGQHYE